MKQLILIMALVLSINAYAQDANKTVTLVVSGQGKTQDEAKQNALRNAIEQAFGTFISSKTEILNDEIVKDEIVSVANGNIQKFEVISEVQIPNGGYATSLKATVSVTKLTSFVESKGVIVEFKGGLFATNILIQEMYEKNELKAIEEIISVTKEILKKSFYGEINADQPKFLKDNEFEMMLQMKVKANSNINNAVNYFYKNIKNLSLAKSDIDNYSSLRKPIFELVIVSSDYLTTGSFTYKIDNAYDMTMRNSPPNYKRTVDYNPEKYIFESVFLRNLSSKKIIESFIEYSMMIPLNFKVLSNGNKVLNYKPDLIAGTIPFSSNDIRRDGILLHFGGTSYRCDSYGWDKGDTQFNNSLAKWFCRGREYKPEYLVLILHRYKENAKIYSFLGQSKLNINEIKEISTIEMVF